MDEYEPLVRALPGPVRHVDYCTRRPTMPHGLMSHIVAADTLRSLRTAFFLSVFICKGAWKPPLPTVHMVHSPMNNGPNGIDVHNFWTPHIDLSSKAVWDDWLK